MYKPSKLTFIMEDIQEKYNHLRQQNEALRQENEELKSLLHAHGIEYKPKYVVEKVAAYSPITFLSTNAYSGRYPFTNSGDIRSVPLYLQ